MRFLRTIASCRLIDERKDIRRRRIFCLSTKVRLPSKLAAELKKVGKRWNYTEATSILPHRKKNSSLWKKQFDGEELEAGKGH
jgi:hypothetical protein